MNSLLAFVLLGSIPIIGGIIAYRINEIGTEIRSGEDSIQHYQANHRLKGEIKELEDAEKNHILRYLHLVKRVESLESIVGFKHADEKLVRNDTLKQEDFTRGYGVGYEAGKREVDGRWNNF